MDNINAKNLDHHQIATRVLEELDGTIDNIGWWAQSVTVAHEQDIGRRIPGQRPDGTFLGASAEGAPAKCGCRDDCPDAILVFKSPRAAYFFSKPDKTRQIRKFADMFSLLLVFS